LEIKMGHFVKWNGNSNGDKPALSKSIQKGVVNSTFKFGVWGMVPGLQVGPNDPSYGTATALGPPGANSITWFNWVPTKPGNVLVEIRDGSNPAWDVFQLAISAADSAAPETVAVSSLRNALKVTFPLLAGFYKEVNGQKMGRLQTIAGGNTNPHFHGLALDIFLFARGYRWPTSEQEERLGDHLFKLFWMNQPRLGWTECIWKLSEMTNGGLPGSYNKGKDLRHVTHIHIDWANYKAGVPVPNGRQSTAFPLELMNALRDLQAQFSSGSLGVVDPAASWVRN
jgi:hypothetical protein